MKSDAPPDGNTPWMLPEPVLHLLRCPVTRRPLRVEQSPTGPVLVTDDGSVRYPVVGGIPVLTPAPTPGKDQ